MIISNKETSNGIVYNAKGDVSIIKTGGLGDGPSLGTAGSGQGKPASVILTFDEFGAWNMSTASVYGANDPASNGTWCDTTSPAGPGDSPQTWAEAGAYTISWECTANIAASPPLGIDDGTFPQIFEVTSNLSTPESHWSGTITITSVGGTSDTISVSLDASTDP